MFVGTGPAHWGQVVIPNSYTNDRCAQGRLCKFG